MRSILLSATLAFAAFDANAGGRATVVCGDNQLPTLVVNYASGIDAGTPGLMFLGILSPDRTNGAVMSEKGWVQYQSGLYPYMIRFDSGLPAIFTRSLPFPAGTTSTLAFEGYSVYMGHGSYTIASKVKVADRRTILNKARPALKAAGTWDQEYDTDDRYIWALVQQDMVVNNKNEFLLTIPLLDCNRNSSD